ncbi:MAG: TatD family hydrolase [Candidatus Paceibacterota bacterium]|jgi:TatD DNase family protein
MFYSTPNTYNLKPVLYFDAHTHLNLQFEKDWQTVGERAFEEGVSFVNIGADLASSQKALEQAEFFGGGGFCSVGLHPTDGRLADFGEITALAENPKVVAIGECGLDYFHCADEPERQAQVELFKKHLDLAFVLNKPLMIHCRPSAGTFDAYEDLFQILREYQDFGKLPRFNMHFFVGDWPLAQKFLALGGYLSFPGVITFSEQYGEIIKKMPLNRLMSETDAPFATPVPFRGQRNEPAYVKYVAEKIAELRPETRAVVLAALVQNAQEFFSL